MGHPAVTPFVFAVCGRKNSGKTTLISHLIRYLEHEGISTAVIKHDGHDFECDIPGTDSRRFYDSGCRNVAVFSGSRYFIHRETSAPDSEKTALLLNTFSNVDVIIIEGLKNRPLPKIELLGRDPAALPVSNPEGRFLLLSDTPGRDYGEPVLASDNTEAVFDTVLKQYRRWRT